jgi:very-short-patch-repair endonuclease
MRASDLLADSGTVIHRASLDRFGVRALERAHREGLVTRLLPGTYALTGIAGELSTRVLAVCVWQPDAVIVGHAAAHLTFWPALRVGDIDVARDARPPHALGYVFHERRIDTADVLESGGVRVTRPALTAVDLAQTLGGDALDTVLRSRAARIADLWDVLDAHPGRRGNVARRRLLIESRDEPWSAAERLGHTILRHHRIRGWKANYEVRVSGRKYFIDVAFPGAHVAIEIDGRFHEDDRTVFEADRYRQNGLVRAGWQVLRFTYAMLLHEPEYVISAIRQALAAARREGFNGLDGS